MPLASESKVMPGVDSSDYLHEPLMEFESSLDIMMEKGITTVTFLSLRGGDIKQVAAFLKKRLTYICASNLWLTGRLIKDKSRNKSIQLAYPKRLHDKDVDSMLHISNDKSLCALNSTDDINLIMTTVATSNALVDTGYSLLNHNDRAMARFALFQTACQNTALVVSISHSVVDGYTYYQILQMLSRDAEILELSPVRKHEIAKSAQDASGRDEFNYMKRPSSIMNFLRMMLCAKRAHCEAFILDQEKVKQIKDSYNGTSPSFVSTNDIVTSTFGKATRSRVMYMAINWRNRMGGLSSKDAGNYETVLLYDPEGYETAGKIRESLEQEPPLLRKSSMPLPGFCESLHSRVTMITNWAFSNFTGDLQLLEEPGTSTVLLHLPAYKPTDSPMNFAVVFRARKDTVAVVYFLTDVTAHDLREAGAPLGESL